MGSKLLPAGQYSGRNGDRGKDLSADRRNGTNLIAPWIIRGGFVLAVLAMTLGMYTLFDALRIRAILSESASPNERGPKGN